MAEACKFCKALAEDKAISFSWLEREWTVALVRRSWVPGNKRHAGRTTDYRNRGIGYKLNYCPECGRKL